MINAKDIDRMHRTQDSLSKAELKIKVFSSFLVDFFWQMEGFFTWVSCEWEKDSIQVAVVGRKKEYAKQMKRNTEARNTEDSVEKLNPTISHLYAYFRKTAKRNM